jgi:DNA-binding response OmpR family regulator
MNSAAHTVVLIEDESSIADVQKLYLIKAGFTVIHCADGASGLQAIRKHKPQAAVVDIGVPVIDGIEVCRALRAENNHVPLLFCTARDDEIDRVLGLELGADDYITKPFSPRELVARVRASIRRSLLVVEPAHEEITLGGVVMDVATRRVNVGGQDVDLTATEFDLLAHLIRHPKRVFSREQLLQDVWGYEGYVTPRTVDTHIAQVRAKLGNVSIIRTVRGVGYSAEVNP